MPGKSTRMPKNTVDYRGKSIELVVKLIELFIKNFNWCVGEIYCNSREIHWYVKKWYARKIIGSTEEIPLHDGKIHWNARKMHKNAEKIHWNANKNQ